MFRETILLTLLSSLIFLFYTKVIAHEDRNYKTALNVGIKLRSSIEAPPQFPGGMGEFCKFISAHTPLKGNTGKTEISFYINKEGTVDIPMVSSELNDSNKIALLTAFAKSPKWQPAVQNGRLMRVGFILAVTFKNIDQVNVITVDHVNMIKEEMIVSFEKVEKNGEMYIQGTVLKTNGEPLVGVNIWPTASPQWTASGIKGEFSMALPDSGSINFSCIGHVAKKVNL